MSKTSSAAEVPELRLGILIDAENISHNVIGLILSEIAKLGNTIFKRVYGDFSHPLLSGWKNQSQMHALQPVHCFRNVSGKSNSDMILTIDAMDWLNSGKIDCLCLVTSDSDFSALAIRIKESSLLVYGFGEIKTPQSLRRACNRFWFVESLKVSENPNHKIIDSNEIENKNMEKEELNLKDVALPWDDLIFEIKRAITDKADANGWAALSTVGHMIGKRFPDFSAQNYGYTKLVYLIENAGFNIQKKGDELNKSTVFVSIKDINK